MFDPTAPREPKRGLRRVLRRESEWTAAEWIGLAVVFGVASFVFGLTHQHHDGLIGSLGVGACIVVGMFGGRRIRRRRLRRRAERQAPVI
ncbi:MAG: hypothetical protein AAGC46_05265 [Solirubrobacteraceae bacterium]|nr:hypothetical protein [Patulibacter sp.]